VSCMVTAGVFLVLHVLKVLEVKTEKKRLMKDA